MTRADAPCIDASWLDEPRSAAVTGMLERGGQRCYFVGGCVRNALIGAPVVDLDIATDARPEQVMELATAAGLKAIPTGIKHGTVTVVSGGKPFEITTFRRDVETFGRRAVVAFSDDIAEDAARRDFTMNALYAATDGSVLDPVGCGVADLRARRVRFVGDAPSRIAEDYLRILRFFRFHAWYGEGAFDPDALAACVEGQAGIDCLSRERIGAELAKLLAAPDPTPAVAAMAETGILDRVLPGADVSLLAPLVAVERAAGAPPRWQRRLAALGDASAWTDSLRLSRTDAAALTAVTKARATGLPLAATAWRFGGEAARDAALIGAAAAGDPPPAGLEPAIARGVAARFPLRADDLPWLSGPALGAALRRLESDWLASDLTLDRQHLLARVHPKRTDVGD